MKITPTLLAALLLGTVAHGALTPAADNGGLTLPPGFRAVVVADKLKPLRNIAVAPNGDLYAKTRKDGVYALRDTNGDRVEDWVPVNDPRVFSEGRNVRVGVGVTF